MKEPLLPSPDHPAYPWHQRPEDHNILGLLDIGPKGMSCSLAALIAGSLLRVTGSSPIGERTMRIRYRAAELRRKYSIPELQALEAARRQVRSGYGLYGRPTKPANSGRKRRVAA